MKFSWKNIENWRSWKMRFFWGGHFEFSKSAILIFFIASSLWKIQPFYMKYCFFLHYGWFSQNLGKEAVRTLMHTTVNVVTFFDKHKVSTAKINIKSTAYFKSLKWINRKKTANLDDEFPLRIDSSNFFKRLFYSYR